MLRSCRTSRCHVQMEFEIQIQLALSFQGHNDMAIFQNDFFIFVFVVPIVLFDFIHKK